MKLNLEKILPVASLGLFVTAVPLYLYNAITSDNTNLQMLYEIICAASVYGASMSEYFAIKEISSNQHLGEVYHG